MKPYSPISFLALVSIGLSGAQAVDFVKDVKPILENNCVRCHNPKGTDFEKGDTDVDLSTKAAAFEVKSTIVPGDPAKSKLYTTTVMADDAKKLMPPKNKVTGEISRLTAPECETLKAWILAGATWPDGVDLVARKKEVAAKGAEAEAALVSQIQKNILAAPNVASEKEMLPYTGTITGVAVNFDMVPVPGGKFQMGTPDAEPGHKAEEGPVHTVEIEPFWMGKFEVTWDEYDLFMYPKEEKTLREAKQPPAELNAITDAVTRPSQPYVEMSFGMGKVGYPAISMTQHGANKYCQWLSAKTGQFYRLPTEAEWEYACRAGSTTAYPWGEDAAKISDYAWWDKNSEFKYQKVGKKKPNAWGLYDMIGNVMEWCLDQYDPGFYANGGLVAPWNKAIKAYPHVARGGSWEDADVALLRSGARRFSDKSWKMLDPQMPKSVWYHTNAQFLGFRIIRPLKTPTPAEMQAYWNSGVEKDNPALIKAD